VPAADDNAVEVRHVAIPCCPYISRQTVRRDVE
jgi:hypothetical protein